MVMEFKCSVCFVPFKANYTLRRHYRNRHPTLELPSLKKYDSSKFRCEECNSGFSFHNSLVRHVKNFHSTRVSPKDVPLIPKKFKCAECSAEYMTKKHLKRHVHSKHSKSVLKKLNTINCSLCSTCFTQKDDLFSHWKLDHAINIETEELKFENKDMFLTWKNKTEIYTKSKFVRNISGFSSSGGKTEYFQCNRSGYFSSKSKGLRHLKTQGTCKINSICPARMKVRVLENGEHLIQFTKTHVGHGHDLGHLSLTQIQREALATKIASQIPFDAILGDVRESIESNLEYGRIHLLTRKDLHNIKQSFNLIPNAVIQQAEADVLSEFNVVEKPRSSETNDAALETSDEISEPNFIYERQDDEVALMVEVASSSNMPTEETALEIMKKEINDSCQKLSAAASSCEELNVIAKLLKEAEPLMNAFRTNSLNSELGQQFEIVVKSEPYINNIEPQ